MDDLPVPVDSGGGVAEVVQQILTFLVGQAEGDDTEELITAVQDISGVLCHPALSTPLENFTCVEFLLLLLVLIEFVKGCAAILRSGFEWIL